MSPKLSVDQPELAKARRGDGGSSIFKPGAGSTEKGKILLCCKFNSPRLAGDTKVISQEEEVNRIGGQVIAGDAHISNGNGIGLNSR